MKFWEISEHGKNRNVLVSSHNTLANTSFQQKNEHSPPVVRSSRIAFAMFGTAHYFTLTHKAYGCIVYIYSNLFPLSTSPQYLTSGSVGLCFISTPPWENYSLLLPDAGFLEFLVYLEGNFVFHTLTCVKVKERQRNPNGFFSG